MAQEDIGLYKKIRINIIQLTLCHVEERIIKYFSLPLLKNKIKLAIFSLVDRNSRRSLERFLIG